ncbi:PREDICTED: prostaglandin G/H synthase 2-like [Priapulus caudatus]|uniref:prostaglandin-endoperoxide synthase n=1 Tax=Priapulus caudatus TaxID=37621 RepID=A0ABM1E955_PRICU|nr:PREDICTED: prostaglandin G/H synthase 2-like [Priapulus caudatus]
MKKKVRKTKVQSIERYLVVVISMACLLSSAATGEDFNPCCSFPCQHRSICVMLSNQAYVCDCTNTGFYGNNCDIRTLLHREFTIKDIAVDLSSIYGETAEKRKQLRSLTGGKFKMQVINGEEWPVLIKDALIETEYPPGYPEERKFALGHPFYALLPGLFVWSTIWMREHNRVCDILKEEHTDWDDERLYQTARLILVGETIKIVIEDYVQHLSQYKFKLKFNPELLFDVPYQYQNRIAVEFNHLYHWHPLLPESFNISGQTYPMKSYMFNSQLAVDHGMYAVIDSMSRQPAGRMSHHNHGPSTLHIAVATLKHGRLLRLQPFNEYRKRFGLRPYGSFEELTGEQEMAAELRELYGEVDALEFSLGLMLEKARAAAMFGSTIIEMGGPFSVKGLMSSPVCSPGYWKPSTFGGDRAFDVIKMASLRRLVCSNIRGPCPFVSFRVPDDVANAVTRQEKSTRDGCREEL